MPSVKISDLPVLSQLSANNANTVFVVVDKTTNTTSQFSTTVLAQGLYANNILNVGTSNTGLLLPNSVAQFISNTQIFSQVNFQNLNRKGSGDIVITADNGDNSNNYLDLGVQGSNMDVDPTFDLPNNDGYLYMHGRDAQKQGNLWIGTATSNTDLIFFTGGHKQANEVARIEDGVGLSLKMPIKFADNTTQNTAASPVAVTLAAQANTIITQGVDATQNTWISSNVAYIQAVLAYIEGVDTTQNTNITTANNHAWAAFAKANNALANTSGTFAGDLTITGNVLTQGTISLNNSSFSTDTAFVKITASNNFVTQTPSNTNYMLHVTGKANSATRVVLDSFGQNTYPIIAGRMGRGSAAAPAAVANNDVMMRIVGNGWTGTQFPSSSPTKIDFVASENYSNTNRGSRIEFWNTPSGSNNIQRIATFNASEVTFSGAVVPEKGFVYTPRVLIGPQTTITVDFINDSIIKADLTADLTLSFTNYTAGKIVEVWLTNTGVTGRTVTHGCSATNSSENATTFTIPSTSSAYIRYFSIDGNLANTFVTSVHA
jgi:hypothetical protein